MFALGDLLTCVNEPVDLFFNIQFAIEWVFDTTLL